MDPTDVGDMVGDATVRVLAGPDLARGAESGEGTHARHGGMYEPRSPAELDPLYHVSLSSVEVSLPRAIV